MTPYEELCKAFKIKPAAGESYKEFAKRAFKKINNASNEQWDAISEDLQCWNNYGQKALERAEPDDDLAESFEMEDKAGAKTGEMTVEFGWPPSSGEAEEEAEGDGEEAPAEEEGEAEEEPAEEEAEETVDSEDNSDQEEVSEESEPEEAAETSTKVKPSKKAGKVKPAPKAAKSKAPEPTPRTGKAKVMAKAAVKVAPKAAAKAAAPAKVKNGGSDRIGETDTIKILAKENPHRDGSKLYGYFKKYKEGMTVAAALKAGVPLVNVRYLRDAGHIKLV